ncbi:transmembrane prediction [Rhodopirellula sp. JC740]|uniref:Transmembrane prediction n=1 Tax=Rhodopirellula halodulae TaxID=2894198 RepID=A0ABS8NEM6_9BACT|nr:transmembrane prediction [Rhodopirellula sp. JC740]MCC9642004.1 transmembrane prediction [Rhodopirellula sp. JC740]
MSTEPDIHPIAKHDSAAERPLSQQLWWIVVSPSLWAVHFMACYLTAAIWCEKAGGQADPFALHFAITVYTVVVLPVMAWVAWNSHREFRRSEPPVPYDFDDPTDRTHFLGFTAFLLTLLSLVATLFTVLVFVFVRSCH